MQVHIRFTRATARIIYYGVVITLVNLIPRLQWFKQLEQMKILHGEKSDARYYIILIFLGKSYHRDEPCRSEARTHNHGIANAVCGEAELYVGAP
jgi:hypothetical protein